MIVGLAGATTEERIAMRTLLAEPIGVALVKTVQIVRMVHRL
jgi:hypothetical protein